MNLNSTRRWALRSPTSQTLGDGADCVLHPAAASWHAEREKPWEDNHHAAPSVPLPCRIVSWGPVRRACAAAGGGFTVEIVSADHLNKPDVGAQIAREWVDRDGVDAVADSVNSGVGFAVNQVMLEKHRTFLATNVGSSDLTGKFCAATTVQWTMDSWAMGSSAARAMMKLEGDSWYFISFDYAFGASLQRDATSMLEKLGGKVVGSVKHPLGTTDFSSYLLQAQSSGAKVVALADTGGRSDQRSQTGGRVRPYAQAETGRAVRADRRRGRHWPESGAGPDCDGVVLLGPE